MPSRMDTVIKACQRASGAHDKLALAESATLSDAGLTTESAIAAFLELMQQQSLGASNLSVEACMENPTLAEIAALMENPTLADIPQDPTSNSDAPARKVASVTSLDRGSRGGVVGLLLAVLALVAPASAFDAPPLPFELDEKGCVVNYDENMHYYPPSRRAMFVKDDVGTPTTTATYKDFSIEYHRTHKILTNHLKPHTDTFVLHHCGTPVSSIVNLPANATMFSVPVTAVSTDTTTALAYLEELGLFDRLALADMTYATSPCLQELQKCGDVKHAAPGYGALTPEYIETVNESSKLHLVSSDKTDIKHDVPFPATSATGLLGRAEWLKFVGAFFNMEPEANRLHRHIERDIYVTQTKAAAEIRAGASPPVVAFVSFSAKSLWTPNDKWSFTRPRYKLEAVLKSGGKPLSLAAFDADFTEGQYSAYDRDTTSLSSLHAALEKVDVLVDETYAYDNFAYSFSTFLSNYGLTDGDVRFPFLAKKQVLRLDATLGQYQYAQGSDWFEKGVLRIDYFVEEIASYEFASLTAAEHTTKFLRNIAVGEMPRLLNDSHSVDPRCVCDGPGWSPAGEPAPVYNACVDDTCIIEPLATIPPPVCAVAWESLAADAGWSPPCDKKANAKPARELRLRRRKMAEGSRRKLAEKAAKKRARWEDDDDGL